MYRKEVNEQSPIRILEKSIHGGLGKGNLGVVMARAGVGKTACLVQIGLDDLLRERPVLHVAVDQDSRHVESWYDALFNDLAATRKLENLEAVRHMVEQRRIIATFTDHDVSPQRLQSTVESFRDTTGFLPAVLLVDGFPWDRHSATRNAALIGAFKSYAQLLGAELWMSAQTHRTTMGDHPTQLMPPWDGYAELIDVAIFLEPHGEDIAVRLLKDHDSPDPSEVRLQLHPDTLRLVIKGEERRNQDMPNSAYTLLSGGAKGAEAAFGACSEEWGLAETNFTFDGRTPVRRRGLVTLTADELAQGAVSPVYVRAHLHRKFPDTPLFQKTLQSIWHQVASAHEVFVVGYVQGDKTIKGGTGWAAELGRHWHKPTYVFDQEKRSWFRWDDATSDWLAIEPPVVRDRRFAGTGTRELSDAGRAAVRDLFQRSFGEPPSWAGAPS